MTQLLRTNKVTVVPRDGAIEIQLHIHITIEGDGVVRAQTGPGLVPPVEKAEDTSFLVPDFTPGRKIANFGKKD